MRKSLYHFFVARNVKSRMNSLKLRETIKTEAEKESEKGNYNPRLARHKSLVGYAMKNSK